VSVSNQLQFRFEKVVSHLENNIKIDAIAARGGPLKPISSGVYKINDKMLADYRSGKYANHASNLGALIAKELTEEFDIPVFVVDPVTVDDFIEIARVSGVPNIERKSRSHALNINYCVRKAAEDYKIDIGYSKFIVAHLGSGFSIAAVENGKIIDVNDALLGMGPFSVERAGALPINGILNEIFINGKSREDVENLFSKRSGLSGYLGTNQFTEIELRVQKKDKSAMLIVDAMVYQIVKEIGGLHASFAGETQALILTGGLSNSVMLTNKLKQYLDFIQPHIVYPGSFELEALSSRVLSVLKGKEKPKDYS
jgi:butyrate kinase